MLKLRSINKIEFDNYIKKQQNTHFMHSSAWGEFEKVTNNITPYYLGLINTENEIVAATLLLKEHLSLNYTNLYAPRGFIIDYNNKELVKTFINKLKQFAKTKKATSIRINPPLMIEDKIIFLLKELNFKKNSAKKLLDYTYQIDLLKTQKEIESKYSNNVKANLNITEKYDLELIIANEKNLEEFFTLNKNQNKEKLETLYEIFQNNEYTKVKLFLNKLHITKTIKILEKELIRINNQLAIIPIDHLDDSSKEKLNILKRQKELTNQNLKQFKNYKLEYGNSLTISAALIIEHNNNVWILSETNHPILIETNLQYRTFNEYIKYFKNNKYTLFNQLSPLENNQTFNEFKKELGGEFKKYIGDYLLIINPITYFIANKILPIKKAKKEK